MATEDCAGRPRQHRSRHGRVPLSAGEIELYARRDEAARRRQRLLDVRDRERRIAQQVTRRYRDNLDRLRAKKARGAQLELTLQHEVLLSELHQRYQRSLQSMGTAHRNARGKLLELLEQANDEATKWQFNEHVVAKHRSGEAIRSHDEEERERLARRWEVEQNLMRLRDLATKQRTQANEHARKELEKQNQRAKEVEESQRLRRENMVEEVVTMPRPHANDVVSYHFTRLHCLSTDPATIGSSRTDVKIVRHNTRHPSAKNGVEEAAKYREEVDKRLEQRRRENEENKETANTRGDEAMDAVTSRKGGEQMMEWLAALDKIERKELSPRSVTDADAGPISRLGRTPESAIEKKFAQMFRIDEEDSGELSVFSAGSEQELDDEEAPPLRSADDEAKRVRLKARASSPFDIQKPSADLSPRSEQPVSSDTEEETESDARLELLKDFLEATTKIKQRSKTGDAPTPLENLQEPPDFSWQPTGKRYTGQSSSRSTPRNRDRPRDEDVNTVSAKPLPAATIDTPLEPQQLSDWTVKATEAPKEAEVETPAAPLGQREPDSDDGYTEQDSLELLEDRLQEVLNLRLRRTAPTMPEDEEGDQGRLGMPPPSTQHPSQVVPGSSAMRVDSHVDSEQYGDYGEKPEHTSEGHTRRHVRDYPSMDERASSVTSAGADTSSGVSDGEDDEWAIEDDNDSRASLRTGDGSGDLGSTRAGLRDSGAGVPKAQRGAGSYVDGKLDRNLGNVPEDAVRVKPDTRHSFEGRASASVTDERRGAEMEQQDPLQTTVRGSGESEDSDAFNGSERRQTVGDAGWPVTVSSRTGTEPQIKVPTVNLESGRGDQTTAKRSSRADPVVTRATEAGNSGAPRESKDAALSRSMLSDDVDTLDGHRFVESELKSMRESARYSRSLSSSSDEDSRSDTRAPNQQATADSSSQDPISAYTNQVRRARRSSTGSSISQYSLPPSDLHSSFDDSTDDIRAHCDDSFVNELVPMFPHPGARRQQLSLRHSEIDALDQHNLPPNEPALARTSTGSNASADVDAESHSSLRVQGSSSPHDAGLRLSHRSSGRFELVEDTQDGPRVSAPRPSTNLRTLIADDHEPRGSRNVHSPGELLDTPTNVFTQYDLPDESDRSSIDEGSFALSRAGDHAFRPSESGSSQSSIGFAVQLTLASGTHRRRKGDEYDVVRRWSQSRIAPMHADAAVAAYKRGLHSRSRKDQPDHVDAELYSRRYSSDSSVSVDGHLNYLASMTATTGEALPIALHLPPRVFGAVDMSKPPAPMQLTGLAASSSSTPTEPAERGSQQPIVPRNRKCRDDRSQSVPSNESDDDNCSDSTEGERVEASIRATQAASPARSSRSSSPRSSWSGGESTNEAYTRLQAMKLRVLPAAPFRDFDMSQPPALDADFFGGSSSSIDDNKGTSEQGSDAEASPAGLSRRQTREEADSQRSHRLSWGGSEKSDDVFEKVEAMKLRGLPAPSFSKGFDMSQPPAPIGDAFEKYPHSSMSSEVSSVSGHDTHDEEATDPRLSLRSSENGDGMYAKLEALPAPPLQGLDMSKPPAPMESLFKQYSIKSSSSDASGFSRGEGHGELGASSHDRRPLRDFEEEEEKHSDVDFGSDDNSSFASASPEPKARAGKSAASLYVPVGGDSGDDVSLAEAFQRRHPRFHLRAEQHQQELERRRQQRQQQQQTQTQRGDTSVANRPSSVTPSSASTAADAPLSEEKQQLLDRLAAGARAKVSDKEMKERSRRRYQQLPEVVERRRQEEVLRRRRERLNELREQEKARRLAQRERRQQQRQNP